VLHRPMRKSDRPGGIHRLRGNRPAGGFPKRSQLRGDLLPRTTGRRAAVRRRGGAATRRVGAAAPRPTTIRTRTGSRQRRHVPIPPGGFRGANPPLRTRSRSPGVGSTPCTAWTPTTGPTAPAICRPGGGPPRGSTAPCPTTGSVEPMSIVT
jgi:hypothetical protein